MLSSTVLLNKAGDVFYRWGIAKPFYLRGYRLHHKNFVMALVPASYAIVAVLIYLHYVRVLWYGFWPSVEITLVLAGICLTLDMAVDAIYDREKRMALLHHEWVYLVVPAYIFTHIVALV